MKFLRHSEKPSWAMALLFASAVMAVIFQPHILAEVANVTASTGPVSFIEGFKGLMITFYGATGVETGNEVLNSLIAT